MCKKQIKNKNSRYLVFLDAKKLYRCASCKYQPPHYGRFKCVYPDDFNENII